MKKPRVCFIADLTAESASGHQRLWALRQLGLTVTDFNQKKYSRGLRREALLAVRLLHRPRWQMHVRQLEQDLWDACQAAQPDIIWMEWPRYYTPAFLRRLKSLPSRPMMISFQDDNPFGTRHLDFWVWHDYLKCVPEFDLHLVKRPSDIENLTRLGAKECRMWMHGVYPEVFHPAPEPIEKTYPVSFVGTCMDRRPELMEHLIADCGLPIHVFGTYWERRSTLPARFPHLFHRPVEGKAYAEVIRHSRICLGLVSESNQDEWTMRTFEVPGCATLLLAGRTPSHLSLFEEGKEAVFFQNKEECADKIKELLAHPEQCEKIGQAAYARCRESNYFLDARMRELLSSLQDRMVVAR